MSDIFIVFILQGLITGMNPMVLIIRQVLYLLISSGFLPMAWGLVNFIFTFQHHI